MTHVLPSQDALRKPESIGKILPEVEMQVIDEEGNEVAPDVVGELCFHRANVIPGYWKRPGLLEESVVGDWFRTGDWAYTDDEGHVFLKGRKKDMIIVGGENVYALEVENTIISNEKVLEAAVVGIEATGMHAYLGELIKAVVVPQPGVKIEEREIKRHCAERLASYKVPHIVEFRNQLPRNPSGKVLKRDLK